MSFDSALCQMEMFYGSEMPDHEFSYKTLCATAKNIDEELEKEVLPFCFLEDGRYFIDDYLLEGNPKANKIKEFFKEYYKVTCNYGRYFNHKLGFPFEKEGIDPSYEIGLMLWEYEVDSRIILTLANLQAQGFTKESLKEAATKRLNEIVSEW